MELGATIGICVAASSITGVVGLVIGFIGGVMWLSMMNNH